jgi:hypothetical protein
MAGDATWDVLQAKVDQQSNLLNEQSNSIAQLSSKLDILEAKDEARAEGKLMAQIEQLKRELSDTKAKKIARAASAAALRKLLEQKRDKPKLRSKPKAGKPPVFQHVAPLPSSPFNKAK